MSQPVTKEHIMHGHRFLASLIVGTALLGPASIQAAGGPQEQHSNTTQKRVYDRSHKDYHVWDDREDQAYRQYYGDQHLKYRGYSTLNNKQQTTYWTWRHAHGGEEK
jgi:hypothetical protein